jgi:hypothetical protein
MPGSDAPNDAQMGQALLEGGLRVVRRHSFDPSINQEYLEVAGIWISR